MLGSIYSLKGKVGNKIKTLSVKEFWECVTRILKVGMIGAASYWMEWGAAA